MSKRSKMSKSKIRLTIFNLIEMKIVKVPRI